MPKALGVIVLAVCLLAAGSAGESSAQTAGLENGSFETGDTDGWEEDVPVGGSIDVVEECDSQCASSPFRPYEPVDGDEFALLKTNGGGSFTTLSQTITTHVGAVISGSAFFFDSEGGSPSFCDEAEVNIFVEGDLEDTPFSAGTCVDSHTDWEDWSFEIPGRTCAEVEVTIEARIANGSDSIADSLMGLDAVEIDDSCEDDDEDEDEEDERRPPALGGLAGALTSVDTAQRNRERANAAGRAAAAAAAAQTAPPASAVRPPSTGDAGLADDSRPGGSTLVLAGASVFLLAAGLGLRARRR